MEECKRRGFIIPPEINAVANSIPIPNFTDLPTQEKLSALVAEINSALLEEFNAFNRIPRDEQSLLNREGSW